MKAFTASYFLAMSIQASVAFAQVPEATDPPASTAALVEAGKPTLEAIEKRLNEAGLCKPLTFDIRSVSGLLGFPIPSFIPIDTNLRWDQSRQSVKRFASSATTVALDFEFACQPSTNGVALDYLGLTPAKLRLDDEVACTGTRLPDGELADLACKVDGRVGRFLAKNLIGLSDKVGRLLPMNLAVPVADETEAKAASEPPVVAGADGSTEAEADAKAQDTSSPSPEATDESKATTPAATNASRPSGQTSGGTDDGTAKAPAGRPSTAAKAH